MRSREAEVLVERMVAVIEQSHRLQLEMLEMWKALLNVGERAPDSHAGQIPEVPAAGVPPDKQTFTIDETAALLGVSSNTANAAIQRGEIPAIRFGRRVLVPKRALMKMLSDT